MTEISDQHPPHASSTFVGIDIGGTKVGAVVLNADGEVMATSRVLTATETPSAVYTSVREALSLVGITGPGSGIGGIGVGTAGLVDRHLGTVSHAVNLGIGEDPLPIAALITRDFAVDVHVENDVNAAALGAFLAFSDNGDSDDLAYLSIGTGIAAGVVLNGRLHRGRRGVAGEIGHLPVARLGPRCECGLQGCLEVVASGSAIERVWPVDSDRNAAAELFAAASEGEIRAVELVDDVADHLAHAVYLLAVTYDVDRIVIGGGVAQTGEPLFRSIDEGLARLGRQSAFVRSLQLQDRVCLSPDGPIGAIGAAAIGAKVLSGNSEGVPL